MSLDIDLDDGGFPPIESDGPYAGPLSGPLARLPRGVRSVAGEAGGMAELVGKVLWSAVRHPTGYWGDVIDEMHFTIKRSWFAITLALFGFLLALSAPSMKWVAVAGITELFGPLLFIQSTRTFTVWVATMLVAGVIGASITAELGSRKVREELDAMRVMGIDPIRALVLPRMLSVTLVTGLLAVPAEIITILSSYVAAWSITGETWSTFDDYEWLTQSPISMLAIVVNCLVTGLVIGAVSCYKGLNAAGGATGLGRAVNQSVVISFLALFVIQLGYTALLLGFFPNVWLFR